MIFSSTFFDFKFVELFPLLLTIIAIVFAYYQLLDIRKHKRIEFTYQLYRDFFNYLNEEKNKDQKDWLFGVVVPNIDKIKIGDLLEHFEAVWSLQNKSLVEIDIVYDLFGYYILKVSAAKCPSVVEYIEELRIQEPEFSADLFIGFESLLKQMQDKKEFYKKEFISQQRLR
jgi:hypothetical protein